MMSSPWSWSSVVLFLLHFYRKRIPDCDDLLLSTTTLKKGSREGSFLTEFEVGNDLHALLTYFVRF